MSTPIPTSDKYESRAIRVEIRRVLLNVWDPIGVRNEPYSQDDYDNYVGQIYELLVGKAPDQDLAEYLYAAAHDHMGLDSLRRADMMSTVTALREIRAAS